MFAEAIESILRDTCTPQVVRAMEAGGNGGELCSLLEEGGYHELLAPEVDGGGATLRDLHDVVVLCGAWALPVPLPQTMLARRLVRDAAALPAGLVTFAPGIARADDGALHAGGVPAGRTAAHVVGCLDDRLVLLSAASAQVVPLGVHGSLACSFRWSREEVRVLDAAVAPERLPSLGALLHAALLAGAMRRVFDLTMEHANARSQFGKPIGKFQAVQQQMSVMAEQVAAACMAAEAAFSSVDTIPSLAMCAVAKARSSEAAQEVATMAHAVHGAIGVTEEYDLQLHTRRLHEWRMAHGSETYWNRVVGQLHADGGETAIADFARSLR